MRSPRSSRLLRTICCMLLLSGLLLFGPVHDRALAQAPTYDVHPDYLVKRWTVEEGLPVNSVTDLLQARDGYLWMTTNDGLVRFDGERFTVFNTSNSPGLPSNRLSQLQEDAAGALWIWSESGAIIRYAEGIFTAFTPEHGLSGAALDLDIYQDADTLWVTTRRGVMRYDAGTLHRYRPDLIDEAVNAMLRDRTGALWFVGPRALVRIEPDGRVRRFTEADGLPRSAEGLFETDLNSVLFEDRDGAIWAGTRSGVVRLRDDRFETLLPA